MKTEGTKKPIIYQMLPRLFANYCENPVPWGSIERNGAGKMDGVTDTVLRSIRELGATHVWYTGVIEHAHVPDYTAWGIARHNPNVIKGQAGSPYAITDYYDIDPDIATDPARRREEFDALVERTHRAGLKVIIDFVPNHLGREYHSDCAPAGVADPGANDDPDMAFSPSNNYYYIPRQRLSGSGGLDLNGAPEPYVEFPARATGNDCFTAFPTPNDWYETVKLNYGVDPADGSKHFDPVPPTWLMMLNVLRYWAGRGVDGFRCDMAHMVPIEFWSWAIPQVKAMRRDIIFIAEIYDVGLYRPYLMHGCFDYLYDKVNLYDTLRGVECCGVSAAQITSCWQTVDGIGHRMLNFLENHDEQRFASAQYAGDARRVLPSLVVSSMISTGPMMIYFGQELGEPGADAEGYSGYDGRTTIFDYWSVGTVRRWLNGGSCDGALDANTLALRNTYARVLNLCNSEAAVREGRFFDLMYVNYRNAQLDPHRHYAFLRSTEDETILVVVNFDSRPARVGVNLPGHAFDCLGIVPGHRKATELLSGRTAMVEVSDTKPFITDIAAHGAVLWRFGTAPQRKKSGAGSKKGGPSEAQPAKMANFADGKTNPQ